MGERAASQTGVLRDLLEERAALGDRAFVDFGAETWTFADAAAIARDAAWALHERGVTAGARVLILLPNGADWLRAWWGAAMLGAQVVPVNPTYRGEPLAHIIRDSRPDLAVAHAGNVEQLVRAGYTGPTLTAWEPGSAAAARWAVPRVPIASGDTRAILYTSGTTGPAKGVVQTYLNAHSAAWIYRERITDRDVLLADLPLFHVGGQTIIVAALEVGARVAFRTSFTGQQYLDTVRATGATVATLVGSMAAFLMNQPRRSDDGDNPLRWAVCSPAPTDPTGMAERFGLEDLYVGYGMTELPTVFFGSALTVPTGSSGRPRPGWEVELRRADGSPAAIGEPGVLHTRAPQRDEIARGYLNHPEATSDAWSADGWFRTGDLFRRDTEGYYYFVDRQTDALRRRGENISSFEVERGVLAHESVAEAACVAAPSDHGDDEVKVFVIAQPGHDLDLDALAAFLHDRLPPHMVPRYLEVVDDLPRSGAGRVQKAALRARGNSDRTYDRLASA